VTELLTPAAPDSVPDSAPGRRTFADLDEMRAAVGEHLGFSAWREITQTQVDLFAEATGDHQWIHVDPEAAREGPFGTTIAHGYLTLSLVPIVLEEVYEVGRLAMGVNYGCNKVRFPAPVPVGSRVRGGVELVAAEPLGDGMQFAMRVTIEREGGDRPVCVAETLAVLYPATDR
jgi:acyl dehydratase